MPEDGTGVRLEALLLADAANVRDGLLSILSAGITRVRLPSFPARFPAFLAMMAYLPPDQVGLVQGGVVLFKYPENADLIAKANFQFQANAERHPGEGLHLPVTLALHNIPFPHAGQVDVQVNLNNAHAGELSFWLVLIESEEDPSSR